MAQLEESAKKVEKQAECVIFDEYYPGATPRADLEQRGDLLTQSFGADHYAIKDVPPEVCLSVWYVRKVTVVK